MDEEVLKHPFYVGQCCIGQLRSGLQFNDLRTLSLMGREPGLNVIGHSSALTKFVHQSGGKYLVRYLQSSKIRTVAQDARLGKA
ncbi:hypothetical protein D3C84_839190 [compost metagenome]